jgi:hypothetical protein
MPESFVLCYAAQRVALARVVSEMPGSLQVEIAGTGSTDSAPGTQRLQVKSAQVLLRWFADVNTSAPSVSADLAEREAWLAAESVRLQLAPAVAELPAGTPVTLDQIADAIAQVSGKAPRDADPWRRAVLCFAVATDREHFRREKSGFVVLDPEAQAQRERREAAARLERELGALASEWLGELEHGRWPGAGYPLEAEFLRALLSLAVHERRSPHWSTLSRTLKLTDADRDAGDRSSGASSLAIVHRVRPWLAAAKAWPGWPEFWLRRAGVQREFPTDTLAEAVRLAADEPASASADVPRVVNPSDAVAYTIDAAGTFDYDDAVSIETDDAGLIVSVHIALPTVELLPGHPVFDEAERRGSSVYTEGGIYPMLPPVLSLARFSLLRGRVREVLTFRFRADAQGLTWLDARPARIEVRANLDYARAERLLADEPGTWGGLAQACEAHATDRIRRGAQVPAHLDVHLDVSDPARVALKHVQRTGPVHRIVEELAIAYNLAAGLYCKRHAIPALYRVQSRHSSRSSDGAGPQRTVALPRAHFSTQGAPHDGLACERYVQATSPNRRFADLVMQRQIAQHVTGATPPFTSEQLSVWSERLAARTAGYDEAERAIQEHWVRVYLTQQPWHEAWGTVRKIEDGAARVWLDELALPAEARSTGRLTLGQRARFRVSEANPDLQRVWVTPV